MLKFPLLLVIAAFLPSKLSAAVSLPRSSPEAEGISSVGLLSVIEAAEKEIDALHSIMILRHGKVVTEGWWAPYRAEEQHYMFSLSKSFTSTAIGLAEAEGKLNIHDLVIDYFPEDLPAEPSNHLKQLRIRDLLMMSTGQHGEDVDTVDYFSETPAAKQFLALPIPHKPGTLFYYNTPASYMLSAIISKATGQHLTEYLKPRLFEPLGIEDPIWDTDPRGIPVGGFGLHLRTEDIAKFGLLYLRRGEWQGKRLLPAEWVDLATSRQASNGSNPDGDWDQGYGFQFWRSRHGFYRGDGAFGQFCIVMPQYDTVVAITSGTRDMGGVMSLLWSKLVPELRAAALPKNAAAEAELQQKMKSLTLPVIKGVANSPIETSVAGKRFVFPENRLLVEALTFTRTADGVRLKIETAGKHYDLPIGQDEWQMGASYPITPSRLAQATDSAIATQGAWTSSDTFVVKSVFYQTPFTQTATLRFGEGRLFLTIQPNVGFGNVDPVQLVGEIK